MRVQHVRENLTSREGASPHELQTFLSPHLLFDRVRDPVENDGGVAEKRV